MTDVIKELNIIDFLGIIVPGCILVLLITGDHTALLLWQDYFGSEATVFIKGAFLLIAGYLAGMVLHEIGDLIEKGMWCFHTLDPKAYAANAVGAEKIEDAMVAAGMLGEDRSEQTCACVISPKLKGTLGCLGMLAVLFFSSFGFCLAMNSSLRVCENSGNASVGAKAYIGVLIILALCVGIITAMAFSFKSRSGKNTICPQHTHNVWKAIHNICVLNPQIQTYLANHGTHSKQTMFDSFRHVMRNLLICIAITNACSIWRPVDVYRDIAVFFLRQVNRQQDFYWLCLWFALIVMVMLIRYNHFAFLRYKYGFENFLEKANKPDETPKEEVRIVYVYTSENAPATAREHAMEGQ